MYAFVYTFSVKKDKYMFTQNVLIQLLTCCVLRSTQPPTRDGVQVKCG